MSWNLPRMRWAVMIGGVSMMTLAAAVLAQDEPTAADLLRQGIEQYEQGDYGEALQLLDRVDAVQLDEDQREQLSRIQNLIQTRLSPADRIEAEGWFTPRGVVGLWPANSRGDDILVWADETRGKLRAQAEIAEADDLCVYALLGVRALGLIDLPALEGYARPLGDGVAFTDPRLGWLGARAVLPREGAEATLQEAGFRLGETAEFERLRLSLGVPEGSGDLEPEKATLIESGFDELRGIDWNKGCFLGQELTARMKYRGLAKKRLVPVEIDGPTPEAGAQIRSDGKPAGTLRSAVDGIGLALIRLDKLDAGTPMAAGDATLTPRKPDWANF